MKHRGMRNIGITAIDFAGRDDAHGGRRFLHNPYLHRRRMGAKQNIVGHVQRILHVPGGMVFGDVQGFEVVIIKLYFRAFGYREPQGHEYVADFSGCLRDGMESTVLKTASGECHIDLLGQERSMPALCR